MSSLPSFVFAACQSGAEAALKHDVTRSRPLWRPAFSRPGFVTFRIPPGDDEAAARASPFARTSGRSLGKATGEHPAALVQAVMTALTERPVPIALPTLRHLHVWPRTPILPGDELPAADATRLADAAVALGTPLCDALAEAWGRTLPLNRDAAIGDAVLDCVVVEPNEVWLGWHRAASIESCWPGGVPSLVAPPDMISRAYLKLAEALLWSQFPIAPGDRCVEIGSSPGGSCQLLLERGCYVLGIDPAEMDPAVLAHPRFTHVRARAKDVKRSLFSDCRWLVADANVAPTYTLDTVEPIVTHRGVRIEGLLLTLKLTDSKLTAKLPAFLERIASWGYAHVRARQLAFNRRELCVAATQRNPR